MPRAPRQDELDWLYMELYNNRDRLNELKDRMAAAYRDRSQALREGSGEQTALGVRRDLMVHAAMMCMAGFPMLSSGDEIGQLNGYGYHDDPALREDSRNLHRTPFRWDNAALRHRTGTVQQRIWDGLRQLGRIRGGAALLRPRRVRHYLGHPRRRRAGHCPPGGEGLLVCLFNFTGQARELRLDGLEGAFTDLITGWDCACGHRAAGPYQYCLCLRAE